MDETYIISESLLQIFSKFYELNSNIYLSFVFIDNDIKKQVVKQSRQISAFSAVSNDLGNIQRIKEDLDTKLIDKLLIDKYQDNYENYLSLLQDFPKLINDDIHQIDIPLIEEFQKKLLNLDKPELRSQTKEIRSTTIEDGITYEYKAEVKTHPNAIIPKLTSYFKWLHKNNDIHPVLLAAITYFKIAQIHPLTEANGRVSKLLSRAVLYKSGIDRELVLTIDDYFLANQNYYFEMIEQTIKTGDMTKWIEFYSKGLLHGAMQTSRLIYKNSAGTVDLINNEIMKLKKREREVLLIIQETQNTSGAEIGRKLNMTRQNVNIILKGLVKKGVIKKIGKNTGVRYIPQLHS